MPTLTVAENKELHFLIARFLSTGPCKRAAQVLIDEMQEQQLSLARTDWTGNSHSLTFADSTQRNDHVADGFLADLCRQGTKVPGVAARTTSLLSAANLFSRKDARGTASRVLATPNPSHYVHAFRSRQMGGRNRHGATVSNQHAQFKSMFKAVDQQYQIQGHNDVIWCITYTNAGDRVITGSDDALVKVWSCVHARLLATFRGHAQSAQSGQISDISVDPQDTMVASGDTAGVIRVWSLETAAALAVLTGHSSDIDVLEFGKSVQAHQQYLVSVSSDFTLRFWKWSKDPSDPEAPPTFDCGVSNIISTKCTKREREQVDYCPGKSKCIKCKILCADFSMGGSFFATGYLNGALKVYKFGQAGPELVFTGSQHKKQIDSLRFSNGGDRIVTASSDGTVRIWFHSDTWTGVQLPMDKALKDGYHNEKCDEAVFTCDDSKIVCTIQSEAVAQPSDEDARKVMKHFTCVWSTSTYQMLHCVDLHKDFITKILAHPSNPDIVVTTGRDAITFVVDVVEGKTLKRMVTQNVSVLLQQQGQPGQPVDNVDAAFAPDGMSFAISNFWGSWATYGWGNPVQLDDVEVEQFFHTDYLPIAM